MQHRPWDKGGEEGVPTSNPTSKAATCVPMASRSVLGTSSGQPSQADGVPDSSIHWMAWMPPSPTVTLHPINPDTDNDDSVAAPW